MKKIRKKIKACMSLMLCLSMICIEAKADMEEVFPDIPGNASYAEAAEFLAESGVLQGDSQGYFNPNSPITRAQAATVICRLIGVEEEALTMRQQIFSDVPSSYWAAGTIAKAAELGIISGYSDGSFRSSDPVTQQQMIKMLVCAWGYRPDAENMGGFPTGYIKIAKSLGIIKSSEEIGNIPANRSAVAEWCYQILSIDPFVEG